MTNAHSLPFNQSHSVLDIKARDERHKVSELQMVYEELKPAFLLIKSRDIKEKDEARRKIEKEFFSRTTRIAPVAAAPEAKPLCFTAAAAGVVGPEQPPAKQVPPVAAAKKTP